MKNIAKQVEIVTRNSKILLFGKPPAACQALLWLLSVHGTYMSFFQQKNCTRSGLVTF